MTTTAYGPIRRLDSVDDQPSAAASALVGEFARRLWEVLSQRRTLTSLAPTLTPTVQRRVEQVLEAMDAAAPHVRSLNQARHSTQARSTGEARSVRVRPIVRQTPGSSPVRTAEQPQQDWQNSTLGLVRAQLVASDAIEGSFTIQVGPRRRSIAVRLERGRRWRCVALELL